MKNVLTASEMKACDHGTIEQAGIPSMVLMERAALAVTEVLLNRYPDRKRILIVAGKGNNGGDGLAIGRLLARAGKQVTFYQMNGSYSEEARKQREILSHLGFPMSDTWPDGEYDIIIDALLGIGISGEVREDAGRIIRKINECKDGNTDLDPLAAPVICAVDLPSGIDTDTGAVCKEAVKADLTVTFQYRKKAHLLYPGREYCGTVYVKDVGIENYGVGPDTAFTYQDEIFRNFLPKRESSGHKGTFGKVLLFAGSREMSGAALLCARAVLESGAGMLKVFTAPENHTLLRTVLPEAMITEDPLEDLAWADVLVAGPGIGTSSDSGKRLKELLERAQIPVVLDADALNRIAQDEKLMDIVQEKAKNFPIIMTPHPGEFQRLSGIPFREYQENREAAIRNFQEKSHVILVSKDACTMVIGKDEERQTARLYLNGTGNDGMATAGSGDVLTGIIGGLLAQKVPPFEAAAKGVYLHGRAGDEAAKHKGKHGMLASDLIDNLWVSFDPDMVQENRS